MRANPRHPSVAERAAGERGSLYGLLAEYDGAEEVVAAAHQAYSAGYRKMDGYSPFPVEELAEAIGFEKTRVPLIVLIGAIIGGLTGLALQYDTMTIAYPLNVGGRPLNSWPAFVPVTFEMTILVAGLFAVFGLLALNGLPEPYHPLFNVPRFEKASQECFFLCIEAADPQFDREGTRRFLESTASREVFDVPY